MGSHERKQERQLKMDKNLKMVLGLIAVAYLLNLTAGIVEILPDNMPLIGNLDEGIAAIIAYQAFAKNKKVI
jgi:hypothetical protein